MLFWIFIDLALFSLIIMIWGFVSARKIAVIKTSSESFGDKAHVLVDRKEVDLDPSDGEIGMRREFKYGKQAGASISAKYSTADMVKAWRSDDRKLRFSIAAIIVGLLGIFIFPGLAFISNGGNQTAIGIGIIVFGLIALFPFFKGLRREAKQH